MKNSSKVIIFTLLFGSLIATGTSAEANDRNSSTNEIILVRGAEVNFANFMTKNAKKLVKTDDWNAFTDVVSLYNVSPSKFMTLSTDRKEAFFLAAENIEVKLRKLRSKEAKVWKQKVVATVAVMKVLWSYQPNIEPTEIYPMEAPATVEVLGL